MARTKMHRKRLIWLAFFVVFGITLVVSMLIYQVQSAVAAPAIQSNQPANPSYAGPDSCKQCHATLVERWTETRHAKAFSSPVFQQDWSQKGSQISCLECHTTGYDSQSGKYAQEGITCEACHGPFQSGHPDQPMSIKADANLCAKCHKSTTDEWRSSVHGQKGIQCQDCHNPHSQQPKAATITELCTNCHKDMGITFTHGTHADKGLQCSNCHMYTAPRTDDPIMGLVPTGHTFSVGSEACIGCHKDTVHTRNEIVKLTGQVAASQNPVTTDELQQKISAQEQSIQTLQANSSIRLYTGLAQGAIVGLVTGGVAAWVVSRRIRVVEEEE